VGVALEVGGFERPEVCLGICGADVGVAGFAAVDYPRVGRVGRGLGDGGRGCG
jgi:hypothetical protein